MNKIAFLSVWVGLECTLVSVSGLEPSVPALFTEAREFIESGIKEGRAPSVAVAVVKDDRLIWAEGFGFADLGARRPATADSIYLLASVSKPITATGLIVLVDRGQVDLDKPANDYLPGPKLQANRGSAREITIRRLANHTSGMQVHYNFYYDNVPPLSHDEVIRRYGIAHTPPGSAVEYCNLAFGILDYITEMVSGVPWRDFMEQNVYDPIGMSHTSDHVRPGPSLLRAQRRDARCRDFGPRLSQRPRRVCGSRQCQWRRFFAEDLRTTHKGLVSRELMRS